MADGQKILGGRFDERFCADRIIRLAPHRPRTALLRRRDAVLRHFIHDALPGARTKPRVVGGQIRPAKGEIEDGLLVRLVHGEEEPFRLRTVLRAQAPPIGSAVLLPVENASGALK